MRHTAQYTVIDDNRDKGKTFIITEMSSAQGEAWAMRVMLALMSAGVNIPEGFADLGIAGLAELGLKLLAGLKWDSLEPLLADMMSCVQIQPSPKVVRELIDEDIEEVSTRLQLRKEFWDLHMGFLSAVIPSLKSEAKAAKNVRKHPTSTSRE